ncbi:MAG: hypothetical protein U5N56_12135 [Candidatus Marinimicrobia bacterium]|nr:hypothetical protein [Candidatus Neomarinimicrobiota bacterium]
MKTVNRNGRIEKKAASLTRGTGFYLKTAVVLVSVFLLPFIAGAAEDIRCSKWKVSLEYLHHRSFSQQSTRIPMKAGFPLILTKTPVFGLGYRREYPGVKHFFSAAISLPGVLDSDNGSGQNYLFNGDESRLFISKLDYRLTMQLFQWKKITAEHAFTSGLLYEYRQLRYLQGGREITRDLNLYIGPRMQAVWQINDKWSLGGFFDGRFYLPYLNYGYLQSLDEAGNEIFSSSYRAFYYQTLSGLRISFQTSAGQRIDLGIKKDDIVGFANRKPLFRPDDVIHYKLRRDLRYYVACTF